MLSNALAASRNPSLIARTHLLHKGTALAARKQPPHDQMSEALDRQLKRIAHDRSRSDYARYLAELRADVRRVIDGGATPEMALKNVTRAELKRQSTNMGKHGMK